MTRRSEQTEADRPELTIPLETACFIIVKAREFDAKDAVTDPDPASDPTEDRQVAVLEDHDDDPALEEMKALISALTIDEQIDLVALTWLGRGDNSAADWEDVRAEAADARNDRTADYLCGTPLLADHLANGLSVLGYSCEDMELDHL